MPSSDLRNRIEDVIFEALLEKGVDYIQPRGLHYHAARRVMEVVGPEIEQAFNEGRTEGQISVTG